MQARRPVGQIEAQSEVGAGRCREKALVICIPAEVRENFADVFMPIPSFAFRDVIDVGYFVLNRVEHSQFMLFNET